jgi:small subunit ribosomal protein S2
MPTIPTLEDMLKAGVHFGHRTSRWHPKMKPLIFGERGGVHIINVEETQKRLAAALAFIEGLAKEGRVVLFVGTKRQAQDAVRRAADSVEMPYVVSRWLGGTITNFSEIQKLIKHFLDLQVKQEKGELKKYTKKEQIWFGREIEDLEKKVGGIRRLEKVPDALFLADIRADKTAFHEAQKKGVPTIALVDTNVNPDDVDYPIPANDDGVRSIEMMVHAVAEAIKEGRAAKESEAVNAAKEPQKSVDSGQAV